MSQDPEPHGSAITPVDAPAAENGTVPDRLSRQDIEPLLAELDLTDSHSVLFFGSRSQERLTEVSDSLLERVRAKDAGPAGDALNDMVMTLRGFDVSDLDPNARVGWLGRLMGKGRDAAKLLQRYEGVRDQIEAVTERLERHKTALMEDIEALDRLYAANLEYFHTLERYIAAGEEKLRELDEEHIPELAKAVEAGGDTLAAQRLRDLRGTRDDLERRVHDLRLTRQVTMQSLPSLRLVQENDKSLVSKMTSTLVNTVPLWRQQLAQALTIHRSRAATATVAAASDLTNELLRANADNLREANAETRRQVERGVFDIEAVSEANRSLIGTIEDSLRIADEGRAARAKASAELNALEAQLRESLAAASARQDGAAGKAPS
ncbi:MAG: toxic anion resistance protein [Gammaproteobacteria bacterium]|nr:toxic anion resistance protein [Gammaproteobacteria bacterium]